MRANPILAPMTMAAMLGACSVVDTKHISRAQTLPSAFQAGWKGQRVCEPLFENAHLRAARCTFPPGGGHERHFHPPHWGYIVQGGKMRITTDAGTAERSLKSGANWWSDGITWHEAINVGAETAVYVIIEPK